jgi:enoyl-CoA hydratase/carnithine racemase
MASGHRVGIARLNAEKSLNALTLEMIDLLAAGFAAWAADDGIALVVLEGAGERAFCAGADLTRLHQACLAHHASAARDDIRANAYALDFFSREYRLDYAIHTFPKPVLCWGQGVVMGGGMGLMSGASHRVVTEQVRIAMPEINIGLYADVAGSWFLGRAPGRTGLFLALTAAQIGAADALFAGLADFHIVQARKTEVLERLRACAWQRDAGANRAALTHLLRELSEPLPTPGPLRQHFDLINALCAAHEPCEVVSAIASLESSDEWLTRAAATLRAGSPTTALLSIELQRRLRIRSLAEVFRAELVASLTCAARPDLAEGIRALIIDKDRKPKWQPATVADVTPAWLEGFFTSPWRPEEHPLADL